VSEPTSSQVPPKKMREWTFMVYMAAGDSHKLDTVAVRDLEEMEIGTRGNDNVGVVVQINRHWPKTAQRFAITDGKTAIAALPALTGETNMADGDTLSAFLKSVVSNDEYRANNYGLVLWGHAFGVGFGRDDGDALLLPKLRRALEELQEARSGKPLEILGTNACSMSYLEAAFELKDVVSLMVASQITVPFAGWPYNVILGRISPYTNKRELAEMIVNAYVTQFDDLPGGDRLAMTVLDLQHAEKCGRRLESLATAIHDEVGNGFNTDTMAELRDIFMGAAAGDVRPLIDLTTLCEMLGGKGTIEMAVPIQTAARDLLAGLRKAPPRNAMEEGDDEQQQTEPTLIMYKRAHPQLVDLKGIGIYAPFVTDQAILDRLELSHQPKGSLDRGWKNYEELALFSGRKRERGTWPSLVYDELKRTIPAELMVEIDGIGALQTGDRADVAQIIMSIEAVLNGLDRAIKNGRRDIVEAIVGPNKTKLDTTGSLSGIEGLSGVATLGSPKTTFGPPWLRLIPALSLQVLKDVAELKQHQPTEAAASPWSRPNGERFDVVDKAVQRLETIERALGAAEKMILRALTHVRFGLGPYSPQKPQLGEVKPGTGLGEVKPGTGIGEVKPGTGEVKPGTGEVKPGTGDVGALLRPGSSTGDLRADLALLRVVDLFKQVAGSLIALEAAAAGVEDLARAMLVVAPVSTPDARDAQRATAQEIDQAFGVLEEASLDTRRTLRRVLAHPVYGLGPGEDPLSIDIREDLAQFGGLTRRFLKLL
jgi:Clostripain family